MKIETLPIDALTPYANNSRTHSDEQISQLAASIHEYGWTNPVLIDDDGGLIAGHGRVLAARELGMQQIPCIRLMGLTDAQKRAYIIADNRLAELSGWDVERLREEMDFVYSQGLDLDTLGFDSDRWQEQLEDLFDDGLQTRAQTAPPERSEDGMKDGAGAPNPEPVPKNPAIVPEKAQEPKSTGLPVPLLIDNCPRPVYQAFRDAKRKLKLKYDYEVLDKLIGYFNDLTTEDAT